MSSLIDNVIRREGGFTDDPRDRGGPTNRGITRATLEWWRKRPVTIEELRALSEQETRDIYEALYLKGPKIDQIPFRPLQEQLLDFGVHSGPSVAIMNLQEILGVTRDGIIGPETLQALSSADPARVNLSLCKRRLMLLTRIVRKDPNQLRFLSGWVSRALEFV